MALADQHALGIDPAFRARVEMALVTAAVAVMSESAAEPGHDVRATYATQVLRSPATMSGPAALAVASNPVINGSSVDGDLQYTINSMFNALAGFSAVP